MFPLRLPERHQALLARQMRRGRRLVQWTREGRLLTELRARRGFLVARALWLRERLLRLAGIRLNLRLMLGLPPMIQVSAAADIRLPTSDAPVISVVIPAYGQVGHSLRCLASLAAYPPALPFEVLLVEDASGDARAREPRAVEGLRYIERPANLGFLASANDAMAQARGEFLLLLNNDTEVMPGAIDALHATLTQEHPGFPGPVGLAGARLLYPDGWLQEAGGILWQDGSAWNWGNRLDPRRPEFCYLREVDYVSGAAIMLPRAAWTAMGGFDPHFLPAYCEDSDLALRLRAAGWRTLYQPAATVMHHEGASHGTDTGQGIKAHQLVNQAKLATRWAATLADHEPNGRNILRARDGVRGTRRVVLVLDNNIPEPDRDAGSRTMLAFMEAMLRQGHSVKFWPINGLATPGYTAALEALGVECLTRPGSGSLPEWLAANAGQLDRVLISRPHVAAAVLPALRAHAAEVPRVFYGHDLHHARLRREAAAEPLRAPELEAEAMRLLAEEKTAWASCRLSLYPSEEEAAEVRRLAPGTQARAITAYALPAAPPLPQPAGREGLIFVAGFAHGPNVDAAEWLVREILPWLHRTHPGLRLSLVGSNPTPAVRALAGPLVEVTGFVTDAELAARYAAARLAICPLRFGAGIKLKVVEALHQGLPLVTTPIGVQGLAGAPCPTADTPEALARHATRLLTDDGAWTALAAAQQGWAAGRFGMPTMMAELEAAFISRLAESAP